MKKLIFFFVLLLPLLNTADALHLSAEEGSISDTSAPCKKIIIKNFLEVPVTITGLTVDATGTDISGDRDNEYIQMTSRDGEAQFQIPAARGRVPGRMILTTRNLHPELVNKETYRFLRIDHVAYEILFNDRPLEGIAEDLSKKDIEKELYERGLYTDAEAADAREMASITQELGDPECRPGKVLRFLPLLEGAYLLLDGTQVGPPARVEYVDPTEE